MFHDALDRRQHARRATRRSRTHIPAELLLDMDPPPRNWDFVEGTVARLSADGVRAPAQSSKKKRSRARFTLGSRLVLLLQGQERERIAMVILALKLPTLTEDQNTSFVTVAGRQLLSGTGFCVESLRISSAPGGLTHVGSL